MSSFEGLSQQVSPVKQSNKVMQGPSMLQFSFDASSDMGCHSGFEHMAGNIASMLALMDWQGGTPSERPTISFESEHIQPPQSTNSLTFH
jgi:hypothetical protein